MAKNRMSALFSQLMAALGIYTKTTASPVYSSLYIWIATAIQKDAV